MGPCRLPHGGRALVLTLLGTGALAGCRGQKPPEPVTARQPATSRAGEATIFTDTALFRRVCAEADSGLTPATARRCTPRDQSHRPPPP
jgi:hypothetical protein